MLQHWRLVEQRFIPLQHDQLDMHFLVTRLTAERKDIKRKYIRRNAMTTGQFAKYPLIIS